jgi:hypothetical protein
MSDTPKDQGESRESSEGGEYTDPTAPLWAQPGAGEPERPGEVTWSTGDQEATQAVSSEGTQQFPSQPPAEPGPAAPAGQSPYGQSPYSQPPAQPQSPYAAGQQGVRAPGAPGAPGVPGYPYGQQPGYAQQQPGYGQQQPAYGQQPSYGQQPAYGYGQSPYARPKQTNSSAIVLLIVSGLSTLFGCLFAIPAVILAIMGLVKQDQSPAESAKFTRWGWIAYVVAVALVVVIGIIVIAIVVGTTSSTTGY